MKERNVKTLIGVISLLIPGILVLCFFVYSGDYYHAERSAMTALESDDTVLVTKLDDGWLFDGPSKNDVLIFYPGAKIEETAYAPLMHALAREGMDVCLMKMPFHLAVFGMNKADEFISRYDYTNRYIGGHSLGGTMAAIYASNHERLLTGVVLLAAYPVEKLDDHLMATTIYGSEDHVLDMTKMKEGEALLPDKAVKTVIEGGNHAQFGNYGEQRGDGKALISAEEQQKQTVEQIIQSKPRAGRGAHE